MKRRQVRAKRPRGRPVKYPLPGAIPDTPENVMRALLAAPPRRENDWDYIERTGRRIRRSRQAAGDR